MAKYNSALTILAVLQKYSDEDNKLTQAEISRLVAERYGDKVDRETIRRGLDNIIAVGFPVKYTVIDRAADTNKWITDIWYDVSEEEKKKKRRRSKKKPE